jgi:hypothetical protein
VQQRWLSIHSLFVARRTCPNISKIEIGQFLTLPWPSPYLEKSRQIKYAVDIVSVPAWFTKLASKTGFVIRRRSYCEITILEEGVGFLGLLV